MSDSLDHDIFEVYFVVDLTIMELLMWKAECQYHVYCNCDFGVELKCELVIADLFSRKLLVLPEFLRNSIYISSVIQ